MKTANDPRHLNRIKAFKAVFAHSFTVQAIPIEHELALAIIQNLETIDPIIQKCAPEWPVSQINRVDLSVLRLAVYELLFKRETPVKVILDEAVEIAKRYGGQSSGSFVNGALAAALNLTERAETVNQEVAPPDVP